MPALAPLLPAVLGTPALPEVLELPPEPSLPESEEQATDVDTAETKPSTAQERILTHLVKARQPLSSTQIRWARSTKLVW